MNCAKPPSVLYFAEPSTNSTTISPVRHAASTNHADTTCQLQYFATFASGSEGERANKILQENPLNILRKVQTQLEIRNQSAERYIPVTNSLPKGEMFARSASTQNPVAQNAINRVIANAAAMTSLLYLVIFFWIALFAS